MLRAARHAAWCIIGMALIMAGMIALAYALHALAVTFRDW